MISKKGDSIKEENSQNGPGFRVHRSVVFGIGPGRRRGKE